MGTDEREALISELTERVTELIDSTSIPESVIEGLKKTQRRQRWWFIIGGISIALDIALSITLVFALIALSHIQHTQTSTTCNLYGLIVPSLSNPQPEQIDTPEKRKAFAAFAKVIFTDYKRLGCTE